MYTYTHINTYMHICTNTQYIHIYMHVYIHNTFTHIHTNTHVMMYDTCFLLDYKCLFFKL